MASIIEKVSKHLGLARDAVQFDGSTIPARDLRWCGLEFKDNSFYVASAEAEARRLITHFGCTKDTRVLDIGCGQGRLPIGILRIIGDLSYLGIDVDKKSIEWCERHIGKRHPTFQFHHMEIFNERYNQRGIKLDESFKFDLPARSRDIIYLYSVFSHTTEADMRTYLKDFLHVLSEDGRVFFSTFVEENVPPITINPSDYVFEKCSGPLHVVRYERGYLFSILENLGFHVDHFTHRTEADGQSALYLSRT